MNERTIDLAREAGFHSHHNPDLYDCMVASDKAIERFAALVAAAEREACARVCDGLAHGDTSNEYKNGYTEAAERCAAAIRARGEGK